jgi:cadherin EGF LAG seven-pass G-type receptor 1
LNAANVMIPMLRHSPHIIAFADAFAYTSNLDDDKAAASATHGGRLSAGERVLHFEGRKQQENNNLYCVHWDDELDTWSSLECDTGVDAAPAFESLPSTFARVNCTCGRGAIFSVVEEFLGDGTDYFQSSESDQLLFTVLGCVTITLLCATTFGQAALNRAGRNSVSIQCYMSASLLVFQIAFLLGVVFNRAIIGRVVECKIMSLVLHFTSLCVFSWLLINFLHVYRMLTELRDINRGRMTFYNVLGFGMPALLVGLTVGVSGRDYRAADFCWMSYRSGAFWGMLAPELICVAFSIILTLLNTKTVFGVKYDSENLHMLRTVFFTNIATLPLLCGIHVSAVIFMNGGSSVVGYIFEGVSVVTALYLLCTLVVTERSRPNRGLRLKASEATQRAQRATTAKSALSYRYETILHIYSHHANADPLSALFFGAKFHFCVFV